MPQPVDNIYHKAQDAWRRPQIRRRIKWVAVIVLVMNLIAWPISGYFLSRLNTAEAAEYLLNPSFTGGTTNWTLSGLSYDSVTFQDTAGSVGAGASGDSVSASGTASQTISTSINSADTVILDGYTSKASVVRTCAVNTVSVQIAKPSTPTTWVTVWTDTTTANSSWTAIGAANVSSYFTESGTYNFRLYGSVTSGTHRNASCNNYFDNMSLDVVPASVVTVSSAGSQVSNIDIPSSGTYMGGAFTFVRNNGSANVTQIIVSDTGTVNATTNLSNLDLYYETAGTCTYDGNETLFGTAASFTSEAATVTGTMAVGTSQVCVYAMLDVGSGASAGQTIDLEITNPSTQVTVSDGSVTPATAVAISGTTTLVVSAADISGTVWTNEAKSTNIGANKTVHLFVNATSKGIAETDTGGAYLFTGITGVAANDSVIVYLDDETENGSTVTIAVNSSTNIATLDIITDHISLEHRTAGPITNADLDDIDGVDATDEDGITIATGNAIFADGFELYVLSGATYTPGGTVTCDSFEAVGAAAFAPGANSVTVSGNWTFSATGTLTTTGTVTFDGTTAQTITTGGKSFAALTINNTGPDGADDDVTITDSLTTSLIDSTFNFQNGHLRLDTYNPNLYIGALYLTISDGAIVEKGTGTWELWGNSDGGSIFLSDNNSAKQDIGIISFKAGTFLGLGTSIKCTSLTALGVSSLGLSTYTLTLAGNGTPLSLSTFYPETGTIEYAPSGTTGVTVESTTYHHVIFNKAGNTFSLETGGITTTGDVTIAAGTLDVVNGLNYPVTVAGNWTNNGTFEPRAGTVALNGAGGSSQILSGTSNTTFYNLYATTSTARAINFKALSTTTVTGTWTATGASGQHIFLGRDGGSGTDQWYINPTVWSVDYVTPSNSNNQAASPINPANYTDGGNNTNWFLTNTAPNNPSSMAQKKTDDTVITTGGWINETSVKFTATVSDTDNPDTLYLCVEKDILGTTFSGTEDFCGSGVSYLGTPMTATVTITGITDANEYHWQARVKDTAGAYSSWVSYDSNLESERDFGIDTTAPTGATIYDGDDGTQHDYNDYNTGSLTALSAYWVNTAPSFNVSGATTTDTYQYSIGTTVGGADIKTWTYTGSSGTDKFVDATGLVLQTGAKYYFCVRAYDNAGNMATFSSAGQQVYPTLSFSVSSNSVTFDNLSNANNWTNSKTTTITTSTNASSGYTAQAYTSDFLRSLSYGSIYIDAFAGTWATPQDWANFCKDDTNDCGFGYTSNDTSVQGSNRFNSGTNYAAYTTTSPGNVVADHTDVVNGTTGAVTNEQFTVTHKVSVNPSQAASIYQTLLYIIVTANF